MNKISHSLTTEETTFVSDVRNIVYAAKEQAFKTANTMMVVSNWLVGQRIVMQEQKGNDRAEYGKRVIAIASEVLTKTFGKGYSETTLRNYRKFYLQFSGMQIQQPLLAELVFSNQQAYYDAITASSQAANSGPFIDFMLSEILETLKSHQGEELNRVHDKVHHKFHDKVHGKYPDITDSAWNVLDYLGEHNSASAAMVAEALGMSERMVRKHIATLKASGLLSRMGSNKNGKWIVDA